MKKLIVAALAAGAALCGTASQATVYTISFDGLGTYDAIIPATYKGSVTFDTGAGTTTSLPGSVTYSNIPLSSLPITDLTLAANGNTVFSGLAGLANISSITLFTTGSILDSLGFDLADSGLGFTSNIVTKSLVSTFTNLTGMGAFKIGSFSISQQSPSTPGNPGNPTSPVPEAATWAMMLAGFGAIGAASRRRKVSYAF